MADLYPETFPLDPDPNDPEFHVFELLRKLPENYSVLYSKKFKGGLRSKEECEVDFIIFDGRQNLICLEVKGGEISYNPSTSKWYQNGKEMPRSPDRQASAATHAVIEFLGADGERINIGWALAFPNCTRPAGSATISEVPNDLLLDERALLDVEAAVGGIEAYLERRHARRGVKRFQAGQILAKLLRSIGFITKIGVRLIRDANQLFEVTQQQLEVLEDLEVNRRMAVMGYAGTGKTVLAQEFAKRLDARGEKVLLLFYNRMVANAVRYGFDRDSPIECATFHSLARKLIEEDDPRWWNDHATDDDTFWSDEAPLRLLDVPDALLPKYDAVLVDEGQDFKPDWFETLERLLVNPTQSRFVVFYDENQDIFGRWNEIPWSNEAPRKVLRRNCRNTKSIIKHLKEVYPTEMIPFEKSPIGEAVRIHNFRSMQDGLKNLKAELEHLLSEGLQPGQVVILIDTPWSDSAISKISRIRTFPVKWMGRTYRESERAIQVTNIETFKGLEAAAVILFEGRAQSTLNPQSIYTKSSRARTLLSVFRKVPETG